MQPRAHMHNERHFKQHSILCGISEFHPQKEKACEKWGENILFLSSWEFSVNGFLCFIKKRMGPFTA
jgi:hypothetical protein